MTTATAPDAAAVLDQLRVIVDRHDAGDDVAELLDEVGGVLRRARARIRTAAKRVQGEPAGKPATPVAPKPEPVALERRPDIPTPVVRPAGIEPRAVPAATRPEPLQVAVPVRRKSPNHQPSTRPVVISSAPASRRSASWRPAVRWLPLAVLAVVVALAVVLGTMSGGPAAVGTAAVLLLVAVLAPLARLADRGGTARSVWPPGRT